MMKIVKLKYRFAAGVLETDIWKGCSCAGIDGESPWIHKGFINGKSFKCFYKLRTFARECSASKQLVPYNSSI